MGFNTPVSAIFLAVNLLFFAFVTSSSAQSVPTPSPSPTCSINNLQVKGLCAKFLLPGLLNITVTVPPTSPCCSLISGLANIEAAACLCTSLKLPPPITLNINATAPVNSVLRGCGKNSPPNFTCVV
ncbi:unnamed protein product [Thlaspi arvense]|uniref:Hydrophobic seed protein domain-containing protein n=1 Tax=Thlaspi arvense TaxID=13288 RepID=A0AAU9RIK0_THLAR|nr:unnamed protein product [Thlaspi arvense]